MPCTNAEGDTDASLEDKTKNCSKDQNTHITVNCLKKDGSCPEHHDKKCSSHPKCRQLNFEGNCCPSKDRDGNDTMLRHQIRHQTTFMSGEVAKMACKYPREWFLFSDSVDGRRGCVEKKDKE